MSGITIKVNLLGNISGLEKHTARQKHAVKVADQEYVSKIILHNDRNPMSCSKSIRVSDSIVNHWVHGEAPEWEDTRDWKRYSTHQRILSYILGFDEGYGVSYEYL